MSDECDFYDWKEWLQEQIDKHGMNYANWTCEKYNLLKRIDLGLFYACICGHLGMVIFIIKMKRIYVKQLDYALWHAGVGGNKDIIDLLINNGATEVSNGLYGACENGRMEIVEWMIKKADQLQKPYDLSDCLKYVCAIGRIDMAVAIIKKGATNFCSALQNAREHNHLKLSLFFIYSGTPLMDENWGKYKFNLNILNHVNRHIHKLHFFIDFYSQQLKTKFMINIVLKKFFPNYFISHIIHPFINH